MVYQQLKTNYKNIRTHINKYKSERNKQINSRSTIIFLIRCRKAGIIPNFIRNKTKHIHDIFNTKEEIPDKIYKTLNTHINNFHNKILNLAIRYKHEIRKQNSKNIKEIETILQQRMTIEDYSKFYEMEKKSDGKIKNNIREKHKKKFNSLIDHQKRELNIRYNDNWFVNKTQTTIPEDIQWLLSHGKKFALPYKKEEFPLLKYIADGEECIKTLNDREVQENARNKFTGILMNYNNKHSLSNREKYTVRTVERTQQFLKTNKNVIILSADKGNVTVAMDKKEYETKMEDIINDIMSYRRLGKDPTNTLQKKNNELVDELYSIRAINETEKRKMKTDTAIAPRIYGLPKIHKENYPLRPICSSINAPSSHLCKYVTNILKKITEDSKYNIKNSGQFKEKLNNITIENDEIMVSFDVVSLFPNIPVDLALKIIEEKWTTISNFTTIPKNLFMKILKFCIFDNRYFQYKDKYYQQKKGLPMGSSASPIVADIIMEELLDRCLEHCDIRPKVLTKYVDDLFGIVKSCAINDILTKFNSFNSNIKFTLEIEEDNKLSYLDTLLVRNKNSIQINWYQKPTASGRLVNFYSKHPRKMIHNTAFNFIKRVLTISDPEFHAQNIKKIENVLRQNSFPKKTIKDLIKKVNKPNATTKEKPTHFYKSVTYVPNLSERFTNSKFIDRNLYKIAPKTNNTLQRLFTNLKSKINNAEKSNIIYQIKCNGNNSTKCNKMYIGTTKNKLKTRLAGHKSDIKLRHQKTNQRTALTTHCAEENHHPDFDKVSVLHCESNYNKRLTLEMLHILNTTTNKRMNYKTDIENCAQSYRFLIGNK